MKTHNDTPGRKLLPVSPAGERPFFALVYQAGIANVFRVRCFNLAPFGRSAERVMQSDFRTCEAFARGAAEAGAVVHSLACNMAGDIADAQWTDDLDAQPFADKFCPVKYTVGI